MHRFSSSITAALLALTAFGAAAQTTGFGYGIDIVSPANEAVVSGGDGDVPVHLSIVPDLTGGDRVELVIDGTPVDPPLAVVDFRLRGVAPGQHVLQARTIDPTGNVGAISQANIFQAW